MPTNTDQLDNARETDRKAGTVGNGVNSRDCMPGDVCMAEFCQCRALCRRQVTKGGRLSLIGAGKGLTRAQCMITVLIMREMPGRISAERRDFKGPTTPLPPVAGV